jgi:shikimate kinase
MKESIVLIGPMGSGKSEVGRAVARRLGHPFIDTDEMVEASAGRSVAEVFAEEGEAGFRARESAAVREAVRAPRAVIACGGGVVLDPGNVAALRSAGAVVYLEVSPATAAGRVGGGMGRPLLAGSSDVGSRLADIIQQRAHLYEATADCRVDAGRPLEAVVASVLEAVSPLIGAAP